MIGKEISHYKIIEEIGRGGMGVVYKAEDTRLKRTVALKFLTSNVLQGVAEKNRFMREAQAAASLNHPNITQIYAIEEFEDQTFIAMEYIDGQSLYQIMNASGARLLQLKNVIDYTIQIAAGLESAHERGVIHRDIKSANIMITSDGTIKIMDFGLAKLADRSKMTVDGSTLGTAAYMSPEQARGEEVDRRSDIWSLGVVLYEMIAGQLPFRGDYEHAVIYSILNDEPQPLTALRSGLPIELDGVITKILEKDPTARYQHVDELPADLKKIESAQSGSSKLSVIKSMTAGDKKSRRRIWATGLVSGLIVGIVLTYVTLNLFYFPQQKSTSYPRQAVIRSILDLPADAPLATVGSSPIGVGQPSLALSPDGTHLVYVAQRGGTTQLYVHPMNSLDSYPLADTEGAYFPFFSPDGKWIGYFSGIFLKKISIQGGKPLAVCEVSSARGATWDSHGNIFFSENQDRIYRVSSQGGRPQLVAELSEYGIFPKILPGEKMLLASNRMHGLLLISIESGEQTLLIDYGSNPHYLSAGYIVYAFRGRLMAVPFDMDEMRVTGPSFPVQEGVRTEVVAGVGQYTISQDGTLVYVAGTSADKGQLVWVDRQGREELLPFDHQFYGDLRISPDGNRAAVTVSATTDDIWIYDLFRGSRTRLTRQGNNNSPVWTPDGMQVLFGSDRDQNRKRIYSRSVTGGEEPKELTEGRPYACSPDGETLAFGLHDDIWLMDFKGTQKPLPFISTPFTDWGPRYSPDGRYIAYTSHESGQPEVYVQPYPQTGERWQISDGGGEEPIWSPNKNEIFYSNGPRWLAAAFKTKPKFEIIHREEMFSGPYMNVPGFGYDVSPDAKRFLLIKGSDVKTVDQIHIITNWFAELERMMRGDK